MVKVGDWHFLASGFDSRRRLQLPIVHIVGREERWGHVKKKTPKGRYDEPIRVDATPEQLIQAIIQPPPKESRSRKVLLRKNRSNR